MVAVLSVCIYACSLLMFEVQYHFRMTSIRYEFPTSISISGVTKTGLITVLCHIHILLQ